MSTFPLEIVFAILSLLPPRDLPSVIRLSKTFVSFGQYLLYQSVDLRSDDLNIHFTVLLLQRDADLCKNIKRATFTTRHSNIMPSWIPANFLNGWDNLRSLKIIGLPFHSVNDQEIFRGSLTRLCLSGALAHLTYQPGANAFPGHDFGIAGLKRLCWKTEQATPLDSQIISVMKSSIKTLTHIAFTGYLSLIEPTCYYDFLDLQFPLLKSLELGSLFNTTSEERSDTAITQFIIRHPQIYHLSLGKFRIGSTSFQFDESLLAEDSLPNLRSFEGFPENITLLAECEVQSLPELTALSLSSDLQDLSTMFTAVEAKLAGGNFLHVRDLRFEFHTDLSHRMKTHYSDIEHQQWIDGFSQICPSVVNWYGTLGPVNRDGLANAFRLYDHLETINLPGISMNLYMPIRDSAMNYFRTIAERSPRLRQVVARKPRYTELEDYVFCLRRGTNDHLDSVFILDGTGAEWSLVEDEE